MSEDDNETIKFYERQIDWRDDIINRYQDGRCRDQSLMIKVLVYSVVSNGLFAFEIWRLSQ